MGMDFLEITDVKTKQDVHKILAQKCMLSGYCVGIASLIFGVAATSYVVKIYPNTLRQVPKEYKMLVGIVLSVGISYKSASFTKNTCERRIIKQLEKLNLEHLTKGIQL